MKYTLYNFKEQILALPLKETYTKQELLIPEFRIDHDGELEIYYAPHNEYINPHARIFIVGITPGFQQMSTAMAVARKQLEEDIPIHEIQYACKVAGRFSGGIRKNIIEMLDELKLDEILQLKDCSELFASQDHLLHTISLIPYSTFISKQNYSGHTPKIMKSECLKKYVYEHFVEEYQQLTDPKDVLLIPLGKAVEEVFLQLSQEGIIEEKQILKGFPHPSGANVNRVQQFQKNKGTMIEFLQQFMKR